MANELAIKELLNREDVQNGLLKRLGDLTKTQTFISTVLDVVRNNAQLKEAEPQSVLYASLTAVSLNLPINSNLGFAYIVPYKQKQTDGTYKDVAQFQLGYKGFIQLAQRSGLFKTISATPVYDGDDDAVVMKRLTAVISPKRGTTIVGYAGYFELLNGFSKTLYMTTEEAKQHGKKFSQNYRKYNSGLWEAEFDAMATKTVIKLLLAKYAPLSIEMQTAVLSDQAVVKEDGGLEYPDNDRVVLDVGKVAEAKEKARILNFIDNAKTVEELQEAEAHLQSAEVKEAYAQKLKLLTK